MEYSVKNMQYSIRVQLYTQKWTAAGRPFCGDAGSRTRVQTKPQKAFYTLILRLIFVISTREGTLD